MVSLVVASLVSLGPVASDFFFSLPYFSGGWARVCLNEGDAGRFQMRKWMAGTAGSSMLEIAGAAGRWMEGVLCSVLKQRCVCPRMSPFGAQKPRERKAWHETDIL